MEIYFYKIFKLVSLWRKMLKFVNKMTYLYKNDKLKISIEQFKIFKIGLLHFFVRLMVSMI